jgi:hypothetical protein
MGFVSILATAACFIVNFLVLVSAGVWRGGVGV